MQIITPARVYPVIVIGSGASGGMAAWNLTRQGIDVLLLDAGDKFDRAKYWTHVRRWQAREREARGERPETFFNPDKEDPIGTEFFQAIKVMTINGYYTSEIGLRQELGDDGVLFMPQFVGCTHPEHQ